MCRTVHGGTVFSALASLQKNSWFQCGTSNELVFLPGFLPPVKNVFVQVVSEAAVRSIQTHYFISIAPSPPLYLSYTEQCCSWTSGNGKGAPGNFVSQEKFKIQSFVLIATELSTLFRCLPTVSHYVFTARPPIASARGPDKHQNSFILVWPC